MNEIKKVLITDIKTLIVTDENDSVEINPSLLEYFTIEELEEIRDTLVMKKNNINETSIGFLDELYEKTKKDEI